MPPTTFNAMQRRTVEVCFRSHATAAVTYRRRTESGALDPETADRAQTFEEIQTTIVSVSHRSIEMPSRSAAGTRRVVERRFMVRVDLEADHEAEGWLHAEPKPGDEVVENGTGPGGTDRVFRVNAVDEDTPTYSRTLTARSE